MIDDFLGNDIIYYLHVLAIQHVDKHKIKQ